MLIHAFSLCASHFVSCTVEVPFWPPCFYWFFGSCFGGHDEAGLLAFEALQGLPRPARGTHGRTPSPPYNVPHTPLGIRRAGCFLFLVFLKCRKCIRGHFLVVFGIRNGPSQGFSRIRRGIRRHPRVRWQIRESQWLLFRTLPCDVAAQQKSHGLATIHPDLSFPPRNILSKIISFETWCVLGPSFVGGTYPVSTSIEISRLRYHVKTQARRGSSFSELGLDPNHTGWTAQSLFFLEESCRVKRSDTQTFSNFSNYFKRVLKLSKRSSSFSK